MTERSLRVTYRKGRPFAAYLHLSHHTGEKSARTVPSSDGRLVVDYGANGKPMGVEITAPLAARHAFGATEYAARGTRRGTASRTGLPAASPRVSCVASLI